MLHRFRLPRRAPIAALTAALAAFIAATAIASEPAAAADPSSTWTVCALEGQLCKFSGTKQVRYGDYHLPGSTWALGSWTSARFTGGVSCTNAAFGDPYPNRVKHCEVDTSPWTFCATEGGWCQVPQGTLREVRYGASTGANRDGKTQDPAAYWKNVDGWLVQQTSDIISCRNIAFGGDPQPGYVKSCWYYNG